MEENKLVFSSDKNSKWGKDREDGWGEGREIHRPKGDRDDFPHVDAPCVPEPSTYALVFIGLVFAIIFNRNCRKKYKTNE